MENLKGLLQKYSPQEPPEIIAIKQYIHAKFEAPSSVGIQGNAIIITVASASLANTLRFDVAGIRAAGNTTKRIVFRIG